MREDGENGEGEARGRTVIITCTEAGVEALKH